MSIKTGEEETEQGHSVQEPRAAASDSAPGGQADEDMALAAECGALMEAIPTYTAAEPAVPSAGAPAKTGEAAPEEHDPDEWAVQPVKGAGYAETKAAPVETAGEREGADAEPKSKDVPDEAGVCASIDAEGGEAEEKDGAVSGGADVKDEVAIAVTNAAEAIRPEEATNGEEGGEAETYSISNGDADAKDETVTPVQSAIGPVEGAKP